ncbi:MAG: FHA domain-containing protein [Bacteroidales bacterium]|nr:FHA domain-containing protein [Bacteroidales bacterium]
MDDILNLQCPRCASVLTVRRVDGIENKNITCPVCKNRALGREFKKPTATPKGTVYNNRASGDTRLIGQLRTMPDGPVYPLQEGRNIIGRQASTSKATIALPPDPDRRTSREHLIINVQQTALNGFVHTVQLYKEQANKTLLDGMPLVPGEELILKNGQLLALPSVTLRFELQGQPTDGFQAAPLP